MSLNNKKIIFRLDANQIKVSDADDGAIGWNNVDLQAYFNNGALDYFDAENYLKPGVQSKNAAAKNMFVLLQNIYNKLKNVDDGAYPAKITAYINDSDSGCYGTAYVRTYHNSGGQFTARAIEINATFMAQCEDGVQALDYRFSINRSQQKTGVVSYTISIGYNIAGPVNLGDAKTSNSEFEYLGITVSNKNGDLVKHIENNLAYNEYEQTQCTGGVTPNNVEIFYSYDLTLFEK